MAQRTIPECRASNGKVHNWWAKKLNLHRKVEKTTALDVQGSAAELL